MTCSEFIARFTEYRDEDPSLTDREAFSAHLSTCVSCRRYGDAVAQGVSVLREMSPIRPRSDFQERLRHSIYTEAEERRRRRHSYDPSGVAVLFAVAALLGLLVWSPLFSGGEPSVELPPLVAGAPLPSPVHPLFQTSAPPALPASIVEAGLWTQSNVLLLEHSPLRSRAVGPAVVRTGGR